MMSYFEQIDPHRLPVHVAVIMDGNGRWAQNRNEERVFGHLHGVESVRATLKAATRAGIRYLTLYAFSTENWNRPQEEVDALMDLLVKTITNELDELMDQGVRLRAIGNLENLPLACKDELLGAIEKTKNNETIDLILALSYSSRWEITEAVRNIARDGIHPDDINENTLDQYLCTGGIPNPELLIRTSGEERISNFLLWQIAYAELYFTKTLWPDFREEEFYRAVCDFQSRERRFGKTSAQISNTKNS